MTEQTRTPTSVRMSMEDGQFVLRFEEPISGLVMTPLEAADLAGRISHGLMLAKMASAPANEPPASVA